MIEHKIFKIAFNKCSELLKNISDNNLEALQNEFGISSAILTEIIEAIKPYDKDTENNFFAINEKEFDVFSYENNIDFGIEATLYSIHNKETELTLHAALIKQESGYKLQYRLIEVQ